MVVYAKAPILAGKADAGWTVGNALIAAGAQQALEISAGTYLSVQPDGTYQTRTAIGAWEKFDYVANQLIARNYDQGQVWVIPCLQV